MSSQSGLRCNLGILPPMHGALQREMCWPKVRQARNSCRGLGMQQSQTSPNLLSKGSPWFSRRIFHCLVMHTVLCHSCSHTKQRVGSMDGSMAGVVSRRHCSTKQAGTHTGWYAAQGGIVDKCRKQVNFLAADACVQSGGSPRNTGCAAASSSADAPATISPGLKQPVRYRYVTRGLQGHSCF